MSAMGMPVALQVDDAAGRTIAQIVGELRSIRRAARLTQAILSSRLSVSANTISDWETRRTNPTLVRLTQWSDELGCCLVVVGPGGEKLLPEPPSPLRGETDDSFRLRRLAGPLKKRREDLRLNQRSLGRLVGVSGSAISYWELTRIPPSSIAQVVWAQRLVCDIALRPTN